MKIDELDLSMRTYNFLCKSGIETVEQLQEMSEEEVRSIKGMSDRKIIEIRAALERAEKEESTPIVPKVVAKKEVPAIDEYNENIGIIKKFLIDAAMDFCAVGYYLKEIRDKEQYKEAGYNNIWECAHAEFGLSKSAASRHMTMNDMYSVGGNSVELDEKYINFNKSQLQEMLSLPENEREKVTPETTVTEIRKLNPNSKANKESVVTSQPKEVMKEVITFPAVQEAIEVPKAQEEFLQSATDNNIPDEAEKVSTDIVATSQQVSEEESAETIIDGIYREVVEETPEIKPLELPVLKNMDQREEFINGYKNWPVWCRNEFTEETFYRFDLPDGTAIVVRHYPYWLGWKNVDIEHKSYYLLKPGYRHFGNTEVNMTVLKDHLKDVQKNRKVG